MTGDVTAHPFRRTLRTTDAGSNSQRHLLFLPHSAESKRISIMTLEECAADALGQRGNVTATQFARCSFIQLGGDSLRAEFDVILRLCDFTSSPTPAGLSRLLEEAVEEATQQAQMNQ